MRTFKDLFKNRTIGFYIGLAACVIALVADIALIVLDYGDKTFSWIVFVFALIGVLSEILVLFFDWDFLTLIPSISLSIAGGMQVYASLPTISDIWNNVIFIGGNQPAAIGFLIVFPVCAVLYIVSCFFRHSKTAK